MPYQVLKKDGKYKLKNIKTGVIVNKSFNSKETAQKAGLNYMNYRGEKGIISGMKILKKNKLDKK